MLKDCLGQRLKFYRTMNNLSQTQLAAKVGISRDYLMRLERGACFPSLDLLEGICNALVIMPINLFLCPQDTADASGLERHIAGFGVWTVNFKTGEEHWSAGLARLLGHHAIVPHPSLESFLKHFPARSRARKSFAAFYRKLFLGERPRPMTCEIVRKAGARISIHARAELVAGRHGDPLSACLMIMDVTEWQGFRSQLVRNRKQLEKVVNEKTRHLGQALEEVRRELELRTVAENAAREKGEQLELLCSAVPAILYSFSPTSGGQDYFSPHVECIWGRTVEEHQQNPLLWLESVHPDDLRRVDAAMRQALRGDQVEVEYRVRDAAGQWRWLHDKTTRIEADHGSLMLKGVAVDITERRLAEEALGKSQAILAQAEQLAGLGSWEWDMVTDVWTLSENWMRMNGCPAAQMTMEQFMATAHPEDHALIRQAMDRTLATGEPFSIRHRVFHQQTGAVMHIHAHGILARDAAGSPVKMYGADLDITERVQNEQRLEQSEALYRALFEKSSEGVILHDMEGNILDANPVALSMFGYSLEEMRALHPVDLIHPDEINQVPADLHAIARGDIATVHRRCLRRDGTVFHLRIRAKSVNGQVFQAILLELPGQGGPSREPVFPVHQGEPLNR